LSCAIPAIKAQRITRGGLFTLSVLLFLLLPSLALPGVAAASFLVLGFKASLSSYSYCVEHSRAAAPAQLRDFLFFVLVDPTFSSDRRSKRVSGPELDGAGAARALVGVLGLAIGACLLTPLGSKLSRHGDVPIAEFQDLRSAALFAGVRFLSTYFEQAGLASFQIGLMRQLGYATPESYNYPFLATSPADFWRRWNLFLGNWLRRYVYMPLSLAAGRHWRSLPPAVAKSAGLVGAFAAAGLMHSAYTYAASFQVNLYWTTWFVFHGFLVLLWAGAGALIGSAGLRFRLPVAELGVRALLSRSCFAAVLCVSIVYWAGT
jgi:hypothetical protein